MPAACKSVFAKENGSAASFGAGMPMHPATDAANCVMETVFFIWIPFLLRPFPPYGAGRLKSFLRLLSLF